jgi:hypothetical protein
VSQESSADVVQEALSLAQPDITKGPPRRSTNRSSLVFAADAVFRELNPPLFTIF